MKLYNFSIKTMIIRIYFYLLT